MHQSGVKLTRSYKVLALIFLNGLFLLLGFITFGFLAKVLISSPDEFGNTPALDLAAVTLSILFCLSLFIIPIIGLWKQRQWGYDFQFALIFLSILHLLLELIFDSTTGLTHTAIQALGIYSDNRTFTLIVTALFFSEVREQIEKGNFRIYRVRALRMTLLIFLCAFIFETQANPEIGKQERESAKQEVTKSLPDTPEKTQKSSATKGPSNWSTFEDYKVGDTFKSSRLHLLTKGLPAGNPLPIYQNTEQPGVIIPYYKKTPLAFAEFIVCRPITAHKILVEGDIALTLESCPEKTSQP